VIDKSDPKGIVAYQQISRQNFEPLHAVNKSMITSENPHSKRENLKFTKLKTPWNIECDKCRNLFEHNFADEVTWS
jgi:hypothetical protein